ncbi:MAG TPA: serine protein kinase [Vicinamibacteria bacterium]|jgi:serine protein kinase
MANAGADALLSIVKQKQDLQGYRERHWTGAFEDYLGIVLDNPKVARNSYQRLFDMILAHGASEYTRHHERHVHYRLFDDPIDKGRDAVFGLDAPLTRLVHNVKSAAYGYGTEKRILLLHGPVGSSKSTICRLLKKGLELYSGTPEGALYTFGWRIDPAAGTESVQWCPMHEEPLHLVPFESQDAVYAEINRRLPPNDYRIVPTGNLCPFCRRTFQDLMTQNDGNWEKVVRHVVVKRLVLSEKDRVGIGTFQPKDEKNQDSTELTGDLNYRKIAEYGSDSDPRAFNFDGELNIANRGIVEFIEILKLDVAFLYDLLGASQEHKIKPKKFPQTDIDEVVAGHTNEPEYRKLQNNELMEAFRDRTVKIDIPYNTVWQEEVKIYARDFNDRQITGKHIAPHTIDMAAMWAVLTRLEEPKKAQITLLQKLKLYGGKTLPGFTEDNIKELREESPREGMDGISPRYIQDKISNALVRDDTGACVNPFMVLNELEAGLHHHSLITREETKKRYRELLGMVKQEYEDVVKNEVQKAISADEEAVARLCGNYVDNIKAYVFREKVRNKFTGQEDDPDERLMRSIEEKIDIAESRKDDFRREIMNYIAALALEGKQFDYRTNERLQKALELKLFEDQKDSIKLTSLVSSVVDRDTQEKIDIVKGRLVKNYGYCEICSVDILNFVASIFARGDSKQR